MEKVIQIYVVKFNDKEVKFSTKASANLAVSVLSKFDIEATVEKTKHTIEL